MNRPFSSLVRCLNSLITVDERVNGDDGGWAVVPNVRALGIGDDKMGKLLSVDLC